MVDFLIDTNILVYAHDPRNEVKQEQAIAVLRTLRTRASGVLSAQCLSEFFRVVTARLPEPLTPGEALSQVERFAIAFRVVDITPLVVIEGCRACAVHGMSIWDALIWSAAKLNQVPLVLTEDAPHGRLLEGVRYLNPFDTAFELAAVE